MLCRVRNFVEDDKRTSTLQLKNNTINSGLSTIPYVEMQGSRVTIGK